MHPQEDYRAVLTILKVIQSQTPGAKGKRGVCSALSYWQSQDEEVWGAESPFSRVKEGLCDNKLHTKRNGFWEEVRTRVLLQPWAQGWGSGLTW